MNDRRRRVVIVGGGAAGVIKAAALARSASAIPLDVRIVERTSRTGSGLAYGTADKTGGRLLEHGVDERQPAPRKASCGNSLPWPFVDS